MEKERQIKIIVIAALFVCISTLTIGFASFSSKLLIRPKAIISPDASLFKVVLSKEQDKEVIGEVIPLGTAENAIISNNNGESKISNLKAIFTNPGEKVVVTIEYDKSGTRADGPFNVEFGDILLHYSTVDTEIKNVPPCTDFNTEVVGGEPNKTKFEDLDNDGKISFGDKITLDTEPFYVINTDEESDKVKMISEWNLNVGVDSIPDTEPNVQSDRCRGYITDSFDFYCTVKFSDDNYWAEEVWDFPSWIYSNQSTISTYLENYKLYLNDHGYNVDSITIPSYYDVVALGCTTSSYGKACKNTPTWLRKTSFWTGSAKNQISIYHVLADGTFGGSSYDNDGHLGIRPFITMSISELKLS